MLLITSAAKQGGKYWILNNIAITRIKHDNGKQKPHISKMFTV